ncbi:MAG TPA: hypothetical protein VKF40_28375 [Burkholderiales bacterium]|nr:hypothetical protein [Burkholderiales bacterium]
MQYTMRSLSCGHAVETLEAHVLARAYESAWRARYGSEPSGPHVIAGLDLVIEFGRSGSDRATLSVPPRTTQSRQPKNLDPMSPGFVPGAAGIGAVRGIAAASPPAPRAPRGSRSRPTTTTSSTR